MQPPLTLLDRFQQAGLLVVIGALMFGVGLVLLRGIGQSSPGRRRHGKFVFGWMLGGWLVGTALGVCMIDNQSYHRNEADVGMAGFGLLMGWLVGMIHGGVVLIMSPNKI
jgi:hypothetical protein